MVIIDASGLAANFRIDSPFDSFEFNGFFANVVATSTSYTYTTLFGNAFTFTGTGFSVNGQDELISGTVTSISIDLDNDGSVDINISGLNLLSTRLFNAITTNIDAPWALILDGPTQIIQGDFEFDFAADFIELSSGVHNGSDDVYLNGADVDGNYITGDADTVDGTAILRGGDDTFDTADTVSGDAIFVEDTAVLRGGDDSIIFTQDFTDGTGRVSVFGDVENARNSSTVVGGDDLIDLGALVQGTATAFGDVDTASTTGSITGGNDILFGGANDDILGGDVGTILGQTSLIGGDDTLHGGDGDDTIYGDYRIESSSGSITGGDDLLFGDAGDDLLFGNEGNDILEGGSGADRLDGGNGSDTASYASSTAAVTIDLSANFFGVASGGDATGDTFTSIENVTGSDFDDILTGDTGINVLSGGAGNDTLEGGGGVRDTLDGGAGIDTAVYTNSTNRVDVSLLSGTGNGGHATRDVLISIENLTGSNVGDTLRGANDANVLDGSGGNDVLIGFNGDDHLLGGAGRDILNGGNGADILDGGAGVDMARYNGSNAGVQIDLLAGTASGGQAQGDTLIGIENLFGSNHNDTLFGDGNNNQIFGHNGDDALAAGGGISSLFGGAGADSFVLGDGFGFVRDFVDDVDQLDVSDYGFATLADALTNLDQVGAHARFRVGDDVLLVLNTDMNDLIDDIFIGNGGGTAKLSPPAGLSKMAAIQEVLLAENPGTSPYLEDDSFIDGHWMNTSDDYTTDMM